ncbi:MAG: hypothetical protein LBS97_06905 [Treponema sp.]|nr:hypothetical protein [Treponema sp.]
MLSVTGCSPAITNTNTPVEIPPAGVTKVNFTEAGSSQKIVLTDLAGQNVYLVKVNKSDSLVNADKTGHVFAASSSRRSVTDAPFPSVSLLPSSGQARPISGVFTTGTGDTVTRYDHSGAQAFNSDPPPAAGIVRQPARSVLERAASYTVGTSIRQFWVEDARGAWIEIDTTLCATGNHSNIWVADVNFGISPLANNDNKITEAQAEALAAKFDAIYGLETSVFGYEYGGGLDTSHENYGGVDKDPKIQILVYDIDFDYSQTQTSGTFGYFWSKDFYSQDSPGMSSYMTNNAELFYLDAHFTDRYPDEAYSTLVHEFQHMINFNVKFIKNTKRSATWYDEMLSMLAEDMIGPLIGIASGSTGHIISGRIPLFLSGYLISGVKEWLQNNNVLFSYANSYAFGAYLARNFGGPALVKEILENDKTDEESVTATLSKLNPGMTFKNALSRYGEAFVFSGSIIPDGAVSFDKTAVSKINGTDYTLARFDIWDMEKSGTTADKALNTGKKGPMVWDLQYWFPMRANSVILQSKNTWQNVSGSLEITAQKPADTNVELYLMVR